MIYFAKEGFGRFQRGGALAPTRGVIRQSHAAPALSRPGSGTHYKPAERSIEYVPLGNDAQSFSIVSLDTGTIRPGLENVRAAALNRHKHLGCTKTAELTAAARRSSPVDLQGAAHRVRRAGRRGRQGVWHQAAGRRSRRGALPRTSGAWHGTGTAGHGPCPSPRRVFLRHIENPGPLRGHARVCRPLQAPPLPLSRSKALLRDDGGEAHGGEGGGDG